MTATTGPVRAPVRHVGQISNPVLRQRMRQGALFIAMLMSGGLLSIPREPLLVMLLLICFALRSPLRIFRPEFSLVWLWILLISGTALIGGGAIQMTELAVRYANFLGGFALLSIYLGETRSTLAEDLFPILRLMAVQAILTPIVYLVASDLFFTFQVNDATYYSFLYVFTFHDTILDASLIKRPDGFFFEPGVFQIYLNVLLFICLFLRKFSAVNVGIAALSVMVTQSTTGALILVLQFAFAYAYWTKLSSRSLRLAILIFGPLLIVPVGLFAAVNLNDKLVGDFRGSAWARNYDFQTGMAIIAEHPVAGIGFDKDRYLDESARLGYKETELSRDATFDRINSNGVLTVFFSVGIPLALAFFWGLLQQRMFRPRLLFAGIIGLSLLTEQLALTPFFLMIIFSGLLIRPKAVRNYLGVGQKAARA